MLNSRRVPSQHVNEAPEINFMDHAWGLCPQLLANEEEFIRLSVPRLESWGASAIDINMGCPVEKALKHNYGVALMGDPAYAREVVRMTVKHARVPVSVKLRAGLQGQDFDDLLVFVDGLMEAGAAWVTIHPRTAEQKRKGAADWNLIKRLKRALPDHSGRKVEIIGNGDVQCHEDILRMFEESECDRVMVGRALIAKPWLIRNEPDPDLETQGAFYGQFLMSVLSEMRAHYSFDAGARRMKFLVVWGKPWVEFGEYLQGRIQASTSYDAMEAAILSFFSQPQKMVKRTALRG
jgi:tRNA-dihydrouridine synthase